MKRPLVALLAILCRQAIAQSPAPIQDPTQMPGPRVTYSCNKKPVPEAIAEMLRHTGYSLACDDWAMRNKSLTLDLHNEDLWKVLRAQLPPKGLDFNVIDRYIFIFPFTATAPVPRSSTSPPPPAKPNPWVILTPITVSHAHTGIQYQNPGLATGASVTLTSRQFDQSASGDIIDRLDGNVRGLLHDTHAGNSRDISIRGRSSLFANPQPLIVMDEFEYFGNYIDPEDIQGVTVLEDGAAASIWGPRSGNGVIIYTSKSGRYNSAPRLHFSTATVFSPRPDLFYRPQLSSAEYIGLERQLFAKGFYDGALADPSFSSVTPAVDILDRERRQSIGHGIAEALLGTLGLHDVRDDLRKYLYRNSLSHRYYLDLSGGGPDEAYYFSTGYERDALGLQANTHDRLSLNATNSYALLHHAMEITTTIHYRHTGDRGNDPGLPPYTYPYAQLADAHGDPLAVNYGYRMGYIDTAGGGLLGDWHYRPLDEYRLTDDRTTLDDYQLQGEWKYRMGKGLSADLVYQFARGRSQRRDLHSPQSYFVRDLRNQYAQIYGQSVNDPLPYGGIREDHDSGYFAHNARAEANYEGHNTDSSRQWNVMIGAEVRDLNIDARSQRLYGYDADHGTSFPVDLVNSYPTYITGESLQIPSGQDQQSNTDRFIAWFANISYTYVKHYALYASLRKDGTNLVGVETNRKWSPFWSVGANREFPTGNGDLLRLRASYGIEGNVANTNAYLVTQALGLNSYGAVESGIANPPDPNLSWERTAVTNAGLDLTLDSGRLWGSLDYFHKKGDGLLGTTTLPPSAGIGNFLGNSAGMEGRGFDLALNASVRFGKWHNTTGLLFSYATDRVSAYAYRPTSNLGYIRGDAPLKGRSSSALFSYEWAGLDHDQGNPQGRLNGSPSTDYAALLGMQGTSGMVYSGPAQPPVYGSLRDELSWNRLSFSFLIGYKFGYYFRRTSINYLATFGGTDPGHPDYDRRWRIPGDERHTDVPSLLYPGDPNRDLFYQYAHVLVVKGDQIRLQYLKLNYEFPSKMLQKSPFGELNVFAFAANLGILWRANRYHLDPDVTDTGSWPAVAGFTFGLRVNLKTTKNEKENNPPAAHSPFDEY